MTTIASRRIAVAALLASCLAPSARAAEVPTPPKLSEVLRLKGGKALVFQPVQMKRGQTLTITHTQFGDGSVKPGEQKIVQLVVYSSKRSDLTGDFPILFTASEIIVGAGAGGGPHVKVFDGYSPEENQGIIAVLIGLLLPAVQTDPVKFVPLPQPDVLSAEVEDPVGIGMLLPAVQKVREAAAR